MSDANAAQREEALEVLSDLAHDLGKYLLRPVAWLPAEADEGALQAAVIQAIEQTLRGPRGVRSAAMIWAEGAEELADLGVARGVPWSHLERAVTQALAWRGRLDGPLDRAAIHTDFAAVGSAIATLMEALRA